MSGIVLENGAEELVCPDDRRDFCEFITRWRIDASTGSRAIRLGVRVRRDLGTRLWILSGGRSPAEQAELTRRFEAGDPTVTHRPARRSLHLVGAALDVGTDFELSSGQWEIVGTMGETLGFRWGGRFTDPDPHHFDMPLNHYPSDEFDWRPCFDCGFPSPIQAITER